MCSTLGQCKHGMLLVFMTHTLLESFSQVENSSTTETAPSSNIPLVEGCVLALISLSIHYMELLVSEGGKL